MDVLLQASYPSWLGLFHAPQAAEMIRILRNDSRLELFNGRM